MTSRTPSSLETGFSGVFFIESRIFRMIPPSSAAEIEEHGAPARVHGASFKSDIPRLAFISNVQAEVPCGLWFTSGSSGNKLPSDPRSRAATLQNGLAQYRDVIAISSR